MRVARISSVADPVHFAAHQKCQFHIIRLKLCSIRTLIFGLMARFKNFIDHIESQNIIYTLISQ